VLMDLEWEGGENLRKPAILWVSEDPPCTRHARDMHETGTSHALASGRIRPLESVAFISPGRVREDPKRWVAREISHHPSDSVRPSGGTSASGAPRVGRTPFTGRIAADAGVMSVWVPKAPAQL
jgi:hypothetical protein